VKNLGVKRVLAKHQAAKTQALEADTGIEVRVPNPIPNDADSATINAYQYGVPDVSERVRLLMLGKMISNPAYDQLRTKEQLGYVVFALLMPHMQTLEMRVIVQGAKKTPDEVDTRIEAVMDSFGQGLRNLSHAEFTRWKASVRSSIAKTDQNMGEEADRFWAQISSDEACFNRRQMALDYLDSFDSPDELAKEFTWFREKPKKVSVRLFGDHSLVAQDPQEKLASLQVIRGDASPEKVAAAKERKFWPDESICQVHRHAI
jgi:secreted Zn-dependent insulinase-like peptidase